MALNKAASLSVPEHPKLHPIFLGVSLGDQLYGLAKAAMGSQNHSELLKNLAGAPNQSSKARILPNDGT